MVSDTLEGLGRSVQARLNCVPGRLGAPVGNISTSTRRLLADASGFVGYGTGGTSGLISGLVLVVVVASSHKILIQRQTTDKGSASRTSGPD